MKNTLANLVTGLLLALASMTTNAIPVVFNFEGTIASDVNSDFATAGLLSSGDSIFGSIQFNLTDMTGGGVLRSDIDGSYTVPSGTVSGLTGSISGATATNLYWSFGGGIGPGAGDLSLVGLGITISGINGFETTVAELLVLNKNSFSVNVRGNELQSWGGSTTSSVGTVMLTSASISGVTIPEPATLALMGLGLAGLGFSRKRVSV